MIPGLVWGRADGATAYGAPSAAAAAAAQQLVYCYAPPVNGVAESGFQLPTSVFQSYQLQQHQQQQQQQMLLAAKTIQQQQQQPQQQLYQFQMPVGLQSSVVPYQVPVSPAASAVAAGMSGLQLQGSMAVQPHLPSMAYLPTEQLYMSAAALAGQTGASRKRGSEEMLLSGINGETISSSLSENNNEAKKAKLDPSAAAAKPSRVLHFRGVPHDVTDSEILQLTLPFGHVTNLVVSKKKNQALVEMAELASAHAAVSFYSQRSPLLRGHAVHVQFSNHDQLLPDELLLQDGEGTAGMDGSTVDEPRTVLRVVVENMLYPVTLDTLKQLFSQYGQILKIVTFTKNGMLHALIQFADMSMAQAAKLGLNGKNIYNGCNLLRVDFSKLPELSVRFNNDKTRDFTNPLLPSGDTPTSAAAVIDQRALALAQHNQLSAAMLPGYGPVLTYTPTAGMMSPGALLLAAAGGGALPTCTVLLVSNLNEEKVTPDALFTLFGVYGDVTRVKIMFNKKDTALVQFSDAGQAQIAMANLDKLKLWGKQLKVTPSKHNLVQMPKEGQPDAGLTKDYTNSPLHRFKKPNSKITTIFFHLLQHSTFPTFQVQARNG